MHIQILAWILFALVGGLFIWGIQRFISRSDAKDEKLQESYHALSLSLERFNAAITRLEHSINSQKKGCDTRHIAVDLHLTKHDGYFKDVFKRITRHDIDIELMKKDTKRCTCVVPDKVSGSK